LEEYHRKSEHILSVSQRRRQQQRAKEKRRKEKRFQRRYQEVLDGHQLADSVGRDLLIFDEAKKNQSRRQFEEWEMSVHDRIQSEILRQINQKSYEKINEDRRKYYQDFLDTTNKKSALFLDTIIESEYDPLEPNRHSIKVKPGRIEDPIKLTLTKQFQESQGSSSGSPSAHDHSIASVRTMVASSSSSSTSSGLVNPRTNLPFSVTRSMLDTREWATGKIESTPHGIFSKMMNSAHDSSSSSSKGKTYASSIHLDHYNVIRGKDILMQEVPKGKRVFPKEERNPISHEED
jgi:hypothetical protein